MSRRLLLFLAAQVALAQGGPGLEGAWMGALQTTPVKLRLGLKVTKAADGSLSAKLDSLDQGASDLPVTSIQQTGQKVVFELKAIGGAYEGSLTPEGSELVGEWRQAGSTMPLTFRRVDKLPALSRPQEPKKPYPYAEEEARYENKPGGSKLAGTLTLPPGDGPFPAVLLITGSGQQNRDEALMGHRPFLVLADHLTRKGIAVLRVDDRGVGGSTGDVANATTEDFAGDALAGVEFLKTRAPRIDARRIGLIGHSEGGVIAAMLAARSRDVAFIVMMAGTGVPGEQVIAEQSEAIGMAMGADRNMLLANRGVQAQVTEIVKQEPDDKVRRQRLSELREKLSEGMQGAAITLDAQFKAAASPWFRFFLMYDPATALRKVTCPVLALNGELDLQVLASRNLPAIEKALAEAGNRDYKTAKLPGLNHLFQTARKGTPDEYGQIEETIAPPALETISDWIGQRTRRAP